MKRAHVEKDLDDRRKRPRADDKSGMLAAMPPELWTIIFHAANENTPGIEVTIYISSLMMFNAVLVAVHLAAVASE